MNQEQLLAESLDVVAIAQIDLATGRFLDASRGFQTLTGYSEEELRALTLPGPPDAVQRRCPARDGSEIWVSVTALPSGIGVVQDITAARVAEAGRSRTQQFVNAVLEASTQAVISVGRHGRITMANVGAEQIYGYTRQELDGQPVELLVPERLRDVHIEHRRRYSGQPSDRPVSRGVEIIGRRKDGSEFPAEISLSYIPEGPDGEPATTAFVTDITARRAAQAALAHASDQFQAILNASTQVAIIGTGLDGVITLFNSGAENLLGYRAADLVGKCTPLAFHLDEEIEQRRRELEAELGCQAQGIGIFVEYVKRASYYNREWTYVRRDGRHLTVSLAVTAVRNTAGALTGFLGVATDVTARRRMEQQLGASNERFDLAVRGSNAGIWDWNLVANQEYFSDRWYELLGYDPGRPPQDCRDWRQCLHPEDGERFAAHLKADLESRMPFDGEYRLRTATGEYRWFHGRGQAIWDEAGRATRMVGSISDITARKNLEQQLARTLRETDQTLRTVIDAAPLAVVSTDAHGKIVTWNPAAERIFGYSAQHVIGSANPAFLETASAARERTVRRKDGSSVEVSVSSAPLRDAEGRAGGVIHLVEDITERKRAEVQLRESEDRYRRFVEIMPDAMFVDLDGRVTFVNPAAVSLFGAASAADHIGKSPFDLYHGDCHAEVRERIRLVLAARGPAPPIELKIFRLDGRVVPVEVAATGFQDGRHTAIQVVLHDLSERRRAEAELRRMARLLITAHEDEARRIAGELHDDLSQNLALVSIDIGKLAALRGLRSEARALLREFQGRIGQVSDAMRFLSHRMHPAILDDLGLEAAAEDFCFSFGKREAIAVNFRCQLSKAPQRPAAGCLYRVLQEALRNVSKHAQATKVAVAIASDGDRIRLSIEDDGQGFLTDGPASQAGLGLISMKERVNALGGEFLVRSAAGTGTHIEVSVPSGPT